AVLGVLLVPRFLDLRRALPDRPGAEIPGGAVYLYSLVLLQRDVTPAVYLAFLAAGLVWTLWRMPGLLLWVVLVFCGFSFFSLCLGNNPSYNLRAQLLPMSFIVLIAGAAASVWMALWGRHRRWGLRLGACGLVGLGILVVLIWKSSITELHDQQLEWLFLERTVPQLPERATLLSAVEIGGGRAGAVPRVLLLWGRKKSQQRAVGGARGGRPAAPWRGPRPAKTCSTTRECSVTSRFPTNPRPTR